MAQCDHCDAETISSMNICAKCHAAGHRAVEHCEACRRELYATVAKLTGVELE